MSEDKESTEKKSSMDNFIEPDTKPLPESDEASIFMKKEKI